MRSGFFSLELLYEHAKQDIAPPKGDGRGVKKHPAWSSYSRVRDQIMVEVPESTGWYVWLKASNSNDIEEIRYVGKTTKNQIASLRARLYDHFKRERYSFWVKGKFSGCTHVIWVADENLSNEQVENVERYLIQWFKPTNNKRRAKPKGDLKLAEEVKNIFETLFTSVRS